MSPSILRAVVAALVLALWLGGAILFSASVAQAAFAVLPTRALAGALVGRVLPVIFLSGIVAGIAFVLLGSSAPRAARASALVTAIACALAQFTVAPRIARLRDAIGPSLDALDPTDPRRLEFGRLHAISVGWLGLAILAAIVAIVVATLAMRRADVTVA